jgi:hypothetical protein
VDEGEEKIGRVHYVVGGGTAFNGSGLSRFVLAVLCYAGQKIVITTLGD